MNIAILIASIVVGFIAGWQSAKICRQNCWMGLHQWEVQECLDGYIVDETEQRVKKCRNCGKMGHW